MAKATAKTQVKSKTTAKPRAKATAKSVTPVAAKSHAPQAKQSAPQSKATGMWKLLEMKEQSLKMAANNRKNRHGQNDKGQFAHQTEHTSKFSGPRRRAA